MYIHTYVVISQTTKNKKTKHKRFKVKGALCTPTLMSYQASGGVDSLKGVAQHA